MNRKELLKQYDFDEYSQQPISFYYCQPGFHPDGYKPIYIWTLMEFERGKAYLRNKRTGIEIQVPVNTKGTNIWGREDWLVDLSRFKEEGEYTLRAEFGNFSAETVPFSINSRVYPNLMEKAAKHAFLKRCGIYCHTNDAYLYSLKRPNFGQVIKHLPLAGGWHDAHDDNQWVSFVWMILYGLLKVEEEFHPQWEKTNESYPYCLSEAWWEIDWLLRMQKPDGTFYHGVFEWFPYKVGEEWKLRVHHQEQNYDDLGKDRRVVLDVWGKNAMRNLLNLPNTPSTAPKYFAYLAHVIRYFARLIKRYDKKIAERCLQAANKTVAYLEGLSEYPPYQAIEVYAGLALYYLECARDEGGRESVKRAEDYVEKIINLQRPEGYFHASKNCRGLEAYPEEAGDERVFVDYPFGYVLSIIEYLNLAKEEKNFSLQLVDTAQKSLERFCEMLEKFCWATVFRQPTEIRFDREPEIIMSAKKTGHGYNPYILSAGVIFTAAGNLLGHSKWKDLGERQLQWVLGANPRFMSFMNQVGVRNSGQYAASSSSVSSKHYQMAFYRHLRDMRWGVTTGLYGSLTQGEYDIYEINASLPQPHNYPNAGLSIVGRYDHKAQETWLNPTGWLLMLIAQIGEYEK